MIYTVDNCPNKNCKNGKIPGCCNSSTWSTCQTCKGRKAGVDNSPTHKAVSSPEYTKGQTIRVVINGVEQERTIKTPSRA